MTQYTSFVAVEEKIVTDSSAPARVDVPTEAAASGGSPAGVSEVVTVSTGANYPGGVTATVNVSAGGAELVETTTTQLSKSFNERQVVELAQTNVGGAFGGGVNNLALLAPNVTSTGGVGVRYGRHRRRTASTQQQLHDRRHRQQRQVGHRPAAICLA